MRRRPTPTDGSGQAATNASSTSWAARSDTSRRALVSTSSSQPLATSSRPETHDTYVSVNDDVASTKADRAAAASGEHLAPARRDHTDRALAGEGQGSPGRGRGVAQRTGEHEGHAVLRGRERDRRTMGDRSTIRVEGGAWIVSVGDSDGPPSSRGPASCAWRSAAYDAARPSFQRNGKTVAPASTATLTADVNRRTSITTITSQIGASASRPSTPHANRYANPDGETSSADALTNGPSGTPRPPAAAWPA